MISRQWINHLNTQTFPQLAKIRGFVEGFILKRIVDDGVEFLIVTDWESIDAIREFAGDQPDLAVVPPRAQAMMVRYDSIVRHYEVEGRYKV